MCAASRSWPCSDGDRAGAIYKNKCSIMKYEADCLREHVPESTGQIAQGQLARRHHRCRYDWGRLCLPGTARCEGQYVANDRRYSTFRSEEHTSELQSRF